MEHTMAEQTQDIVRSKRSLSLRDVNGFVLVLFALTATFTLTTLTEADYRAQEAERVAATQAEDTMSVKTALSTGYICNPDQEHQWAG